MSKDIEVEIRGPLAKDKYDELIRLFEADGNKIGDKERILIDYSTFLPGGVEKRQTDIRLRVTNGVPEIIIKVGGWGGSDQRRELSVLAKPGEFDKLVQIFGHLGLSKGMLCQRKSQVYEYQRIEFSLVEVPGHSYYYEAEKMISDNEDANQVTQEIEKGCRRLGLEVFSQKQFFDYINQLNSEANEVFDFNNYEDGYFKQRFGL